MSGELSIEERVRKSFADQAAGCARLGSSFMDILMRGLGERLDKSTKTGGRILEWTGDPEPEKDALALRLAGALHALARSKRYKPLSYFYEEPDRCIEPDFLPTVMNAVCEFDTEILPWLDFAPQTNEVARASAIFAGLSVISVRFGLPLSLHEMGCSGGLNLQCTKFGYKFDGEQFGDPGSQLQLAPEWEGELSPRENIVIAGRKGCDLNPLSVINPDDAARLIAYLWPDQPARIARVEAAIEIAKSDPPGLVKADAAEWVEDTFRSGRGTGQTSVLYDTIAWNYFPQTVKDRISAHMKSVSAQASEDNPLAWLTFEFDEEGGGPFLKLRTWPGNGEAEILASADPHVYGIRWY